jgi:hypothetical protein
MFSTALIKFPGICAEPKTHNIEMPVQYRAHMRQFKM